MRRVDTFYQIHIHKPTETDTQEELQEEMSPLQKNSNIKLCELHRSEGPPSKNLQTINAVEVVEKRGLSCTIGGNVNWYNPMENNMVTS